MYRLKLLVVVVLATNTFLVPSQAPAQKPDRNRSADELTTPEKSRVDALIEMAVRKESAGEFAERDRMLDEAASIAGTRHLKLNNLRGLVFEHGKWSTPAEVAHQTDRDQKLAQYRQLRQDSRDTLAGNLELAQWCERSGLENEARAHWLRALDFDIDNSEVRARLGHVNIGNRWVTPAQIQTANEAAETARQLLAKHKDETSKLVRLLAASNKKKQAEGLARLGQVADPEWIIPLELVFVPLNEEVALIALERLAFFEEREATQALMRIAVYHPSPAVREQAASRLGSREKADYVPDLISMLATPVTSQFSIQPNLTGGLLYQHLFTQQTDEKDIVRLTGTNLVNDSTGPVGRVNPRATMRAAQQAVSRAEELENAKEIYNRGVEQQNQVVTGVLSRATNLDLGNDPTKWWNWWNNENEVYVANRPVSYANTVVTTVAPSDSLPVGASVTSGPASSSECLVAGTKIWTSTGLVPVERLTVGDRVLARDVETGNLSYRPIIRPTVRPASPTVEIRLDGEVIKASGGHPFWVSGQGWVKARDLTAEMRLETVRGSVPVLSVKPDSVFELYNMIVDQDANYFVGDLGVLSHDNTIPSRGARSLMALDSR